MGIVEMLNALGVVLASNPASASQGTGSAMVIAALGMQLVIILVFVLLAGLFHRPRKARDEARAHGLDRLVLQHGPEPRTAL